MDMKRISAITASLAILCQLLPPVLFAKDKSIYGMDNRLEYFEAGEDMQKLADSVVLLWASEDMELDERTGMYFLETMTLREKLSDRYPLCPGVKFAGQPTGAFGACGGALVGEDLVMTAGHCVPDDAACEDRKIVFGFAIKEPGGSAPDKVPQRDVYDCKTIVKRSFSRDPEWSPPPGQKMGEDYALIRLDRKVTGHKPLAINRKQKLAWGEQLFIIGNPQGIPLKVAGGASVRDVTKIGYFLTDLDSFGGNSGSPVFNASTHLIEGILSGGERDFRPTEERCWVMAVYPQNEGRGERVTRVSALEALIPELKPARPAGFHAMRVETFPLTDENVKQRFGINFR
jgi:hypothetical protein